MSKNVLESPRMWGKARKARTNLALDAETSHRLGLIAKAENPHGGQKKLVVKELVDNRYDELVKEGKIKA